MERSESLEEQCLPDVTTWKLLRYAHEQRAEVRVGVVARGGFLGR